MNVKMPLSMHANGAAGTSLTDILRTTRKINVQGENIK